MCIYRPKYLIKIYYSNILFIYISAYSVGLYNLYTSHMHPARSSRVSACIYTYAYAKGQTQYFCK